MTNKSKTLEMPCLVVDKATARKIRNQFGDAFITETADRDFFIVTMFIVPIAPDGCEAKFCTLKELDDAVAFAKEVCKK